MDLMRNAVANVSVGWWAVDLAGKLTDVGVFLCWSLFLTPCVYQRNEQSTNWNVPPPLDAVLVEIARLAEDAQV